MMIPRERKLVRVYVELPSEAAERYRAERKADVLMDQVATIMQPYTMKTSHIDWSTIYTVRPPLLTINRLRVNRTRSDNASAARLGSTTASSSPETPSTHTRRKQAKG